MLHCAVNVFYDVYRSAIAFLFLFMAMLTLTKVRPENNNATALHPTVANTIKRIVRVTSWAYLEIHHFCVLRYRQKFMFSTEQRENKYH